MVGKRKEGEGMDNEREWRGRREEEGGKAGKGREGQERKCRIKCGENINIV